MIWFIFKHVEIFLSKFDSVAVAHSLASVRENFIFIFIHLCFNGLAYNLLAAKQLNAIAEEWSTMLCGAFRRKTDLLAPYLIDLSLTFKIVFSSEGAPITTVYGSSVFFLLILYLQHYLARNSDVLFLTILNQIAN